MKIKQSKILQTNRLIEICKKENVNFESIKILFDSVRTKKLMKRNNYHQQKINDVIEKAVK